MSVAKLKKIPSSDTMGTTEALLGGIHWGDIRIEYDGSDNAIFVGLTPVAGTAEADPEWWVLKINWVSGNAEEIQVRFGSWDDRATLGWTI